jgi:thiamine-monophosphate kinase
MDERAALALVGDRVAAAGDDAATVDGLVVTTDMLHERTDFPAGTTRYTAGWRAVGASLSDVAAMGAEATAAVAVYAAPAFDDGELSAFLSGCSEVCAAVGAEYVGGDLDGHDEFTVATTAVGEAADPVRRSGAEPGEAVCVTGTVGRSAAAVRLFERGGHERANDLFRFHPRVAAGRAVASQASAMIDSSDGLARSLHQLAAESDCGFDVAADAIPVDPAVDDVAADAADRRELSVHFGEDFELVFTVPETAVGAVTADAPVAVTPVGRVTDAGVRLDDEPLADRGFTH